jgi:hypothetical protein
MTGRFRLHQNAIDARDGKGLQRFPADTVGATRRRVHDQ